MSGKLIAPLPPAQNQKLVDAAKAFFEVIEAEAVASDPKYKGITVAQQRGTLIAIAVQALGMTAAHPEGMDFAHVCHAIGLGFGGLTVDEDPAARIACLQLFARGMQYAHENTLHAAKPEGGVQ